MIRCFNAATAFVPWRTRAQTTFTTRPTALQCGHGLVPWRTPAPDHLFIRHVASMRPRPVPWRTPHLIEPGHSPRRGFNAATARAVENDGSPGTRISGDGRLQCGHGLRAVENEYAVGAALKPLRASMRPRPVPWRTSAGWPRTPRRPKKLQCGHGLVPWRTDAGDRIRTAIFELQCGHGLVPWRTPDRSPTPQSVAQLQCGHGLVPWRTGQWSRWGRAVCLLQCGHGPCRGEPP